MLSLQSQAQSLAERISVLRKKRDKNQLLVHEIYASIQGESSYMGLPCVFVRTTGCHLRCSYCDTEHAFFMGQEMSLKDIFERITSYNINLVEITGGEPLLQPPTVALINILIAQGFTTLIETSGAVSIAPLNRQTKVILDVKTPSSGEHTRNIDKNLTILWPGCEVKFVIGTREDYDYAKSMCQKYNLFQTTHVLFSPIMAKLNPSILGDWILADTIPARLQVQLHRILYGEARGR